MASVWKLFAFKLKIATAVINMFMKLYRQYILTTLTWDIQCEKFILGGV